MTDEPVHPPDFAAARDGWLLGLFQSGDSPVAIVEAFNGEIHQTFTEYVRFQRSEIDILMERVLEETKERVAKSRWPETEKTIKELFIKHAFTK
jgi:hypothetical protein